MADRHRFNLYLQQGDRPLP